jgi:hypothetical protein
LDYMIWFGIGLGILCAIFILCMHISHWWWNRSQPVEEVPARLVAKRTEVSGGANNTSARTDYYVTFERKDGTRQEFPVSGTTYGLVAEGDRGILICQGTWFKGFRRKTASAV